MKKRIAIFGSTGSIGTSTLDVIGRHPGRFEVFALSASSQVELMLAQYGVGADYSDAAGGYTPAWQELVTGVPAAAAARIAREFASNAEESQGRSMILMGAGTNHWFHSDTIYRGFLALTTLTGCQGVNGGGWAHYVGQEKVRPISGWSTVAFGLDWHVPFLHVRRIESVAEAIRWLMNEGTRWRRITRLGRAPMSTAAVANSSSRRARSLERTARARPVQSSSPRISVIPK